MLTTNVGAAAAVVGSGAVVIVVGAAATVSVVTVVVVVVVLSTVALSAAVTVAALLISGVAGVFLERSRFVGRRVLVALLTFPLAFPGVVVGFMVIMLAGRQGLIGDLVGRIAGVKPVFAYSMAGLFLGYLYFSIPRVILTVMAAAEKLDAQLEEGNHEYTSQRCIDPQPGNEEFRSI